MHWFETILSAFRRAPRRPLAMRRPAQAARREIPLGMEATDLSLIDKVARRNDALERTSAPRTIHQAGSFSTAASTDVAPMPEDETYAARYHRAFMKKKSKP
ncbi:MAG: hypothetical protein AAF601_11650 [Pseudomonadota bacterium]